MTPSTANWNTLIANVTALLLPVDWGSPTQSEVVGYDNLCFQPGTCAKADFTFTPACAGAAVQFTSTSTGASSYSWTFSGGTPATSTAPNPTPSFATSGNHAVTLCINGGTAAPLCITKPVAIKPKPATPVINGPLMTCNSPATYCVNPAAAGVSYSWTASNGTLVGSSTGQCVQVNWTNPQQNGVVTVTATNQDGCTSRAVLDVKPCTSWLADCCRCNELSVKDEKLAGSNFTAALTASPMPVTRVAVDLISTSVVPSSGCGTAGSRDSYILSGSLPPATSMLPVSPASREILFTYGSPTTLSAAPMSLNLQLPPVGGSWWCGDSLSFCLKYSFTGRDCKTCELIECYGPYKRGGIIIDHVLDDVTAQVAFDLRVDIPAGEGGTRPPTGKLLLRLKPGSGAAGAKLSGRTRIELVRGAATFSGLTIDRAGEGYVLELLVDEATEPVAESEPFAVKPPAAVGPDAATGLALSITPLPPPATPGGGGWRRPRRSSPRWRRGRAPPPASVGRRRGARAGGSATASGRGGGRG